MIRIFYIQLNYLEDVEHFIKRNDLELILKEENVFNNSISFKLKIKFNSEIDEYNLNKLLSRLYVNQYLKKETKLIQILNKFKRK